MKESYGVTPKFHLASLQILTVANRQLEDYAKYGCKLTVKQLYYRLVEEGLVKNSIQGYDNLVSLMTKARLAGLVDWEAISDDTFQYADSAIVVVTHKESLASALWYECDKLGVQVKYIRAYPSITTLRYFARRLILLPHPAVLHLADCTHAASMVAKDFKDRMDLFLKDQKLNYKLIGLTEEQAHEQNLKTNPNNTGYELEALDPLRLQSLVLDNINELTR